MSLRDHATAARITAQTMGETADKCADAINRHMLLAFSTAYFAAADAMDAKVSAEFRAIDTRCTIDHKLLKVAKCPACGAPRG